jgi:hypothetical protein
MGPYQFLYDVLVKRAGKRAGPPGQVEAQKSGADGLQLDLTSRADGTADRLLDHQEDLVAGDPVIVVEMPGDVIMPCHWRSMSARGHDGKPWYSRVLTSASSC